MKKLFLMLSLLPFLAAAQQSYILTGKLPAVKTPTKAYLTFLKNGAWVETDSTEVKNGKFQFTGTLDEPKDVILAVRPTTTGKRDYISFILENSKITLESKSTLANALVTGSVAEKENSEREAMIKPLTEKIMSLQKEYGKKNKDGQFEKPIEIRKKAGDAVSMLVAEIKNTNRKFVESHLNSYAGLSAYNLYILDSKFVAKEEEPLFNRFSAALKSSPLGKRTLEKIEIGKRRQEGSKATDFTQNDQNGKPFTLSSLRGKYVLVDFWASWCVPCRAENPNVVKAYNALKGDKFEIVSVSLDAGKEQWLAAIETDGMPWIHVSDLKYWKNEVAVMYGINSVPQNILLDPTGVIVAKNLRGENLTELLKNYIK
ncbi:TlpA disulfide reductase family protein [Pedobacter sp. SL55]|uniref:TlpA disulfide reductase family protein n=1 Tax=Pedobacter sp. SL55 TaxID=2995161 RepID=UPI00226D59BA|nr:TlpA disulfide reductase family protein [Pedobacter sp. SL55]WAC42467.1 TlpA disulfide reductase family protein [Pedobacter sp. SL55]